MSFKSEIDELQRARNLILMLSERVPYMRSKAEGDGAKILMQAHGIDSFIWVSNSIAKYLNSFNPKTPAHIIEDGDVLLLAPLSNHTKLTETLAVIDTICGWLNDPFIHSSTMDYRNASLVNLEKAMLQIASILDNMTRRY